MQTYYFDSWAVQANFAGTTPETWVDITQDIVITNNVEGEYGIPGNGALDRVAGPGYITFTLKNSTLNSAGLLGYYSPGHVNCRTGFAPGLDVRIVFTLDGLPVQKWIGKIPTDGINVEPGIYGNRYTYVTAKGWFYQASIHPMKGFPLATDKTIMEAVPLVLANMDIQPPGTADYRTGESTFSYVGDTITSKTSALSEFGKMVQSELSFIYQTRFGLRVEGRLTRNTEKTALDSYPQARGEWVPLLDEDGNTFDIDGADEELLLSDSTTAYFDNSQIDMVPSFGANFYNSAKFTALPRRVDATATTVLWNLQSPMSIDAGASDVIIGGSYKDPTGVAKKVSGFAMTTPAATTHYKCYENKDGTGTDLTANLTVSAVDPVTGLSSMGTGDFKYYISNSGAAGYITLCKAIGKGIYTDIPAEYYVEDAVSIAKHGDYPLVVNMPYQDDPMVASRWAQVSLYQYKNLITSVDSITYAANKSGDFLSAFLYLEPGDRIRIKEDMTNVYGDFFIHAVKFTIMPGNLVNFTWVLRACGLDTFNFVKWTQDSTPVAGYGTWSDPIYGWDF